MTSSSLSVQSPAVPAVLGIDISKLYFDAALVKTTAKGKVGKVGDAKPQRFDNTPEGFKHLQAWLKTCHVQQVHACLEATGRYGDDLAVWLHTQDHVVSIVNPAVIHAYANVQSRRNKTDALDAALIARYCLNERPHAWTPPAQETLDLQALLKRLEDLKTMRQQESNRLASIIPCPQAEAFIQAHIDFLDQQIAALDAAVKAHIKTVPTFMSQFKLLLSIPGIGALTAMRLIAFDLLRFEDADAAVAMAGLNPS